MIYMTVVKWTAITQGRVFRLAIWNKFGPWCMEGLVQVMYPSWDKPHCPIGWSEQAVERDDGWLGMRIKKVAPLCLPQLDVAMECFVSSYWNLLLWQTPKVHIDWTIFGALVTAANWWLKVWMGQVWLEGKWHGTSRNWVNEDEFQMTAVQQLTTLSHSMMSLMRCFTLHCVSVHQYEYVS